MVAVHEQTEAANRPNYHQLVLLLLILGFGLRLIGLGQHSYWFDEAREVLRAMTSWPDVLFVSEGADPPLYRLLLFPLASITIAEFWLRLPSVLFSVFTIYLAYYWLQLLDHPRLGLITALLLTVSPIQIYYAQEVSQYSMVVFLAYLILIVFERAARNGRWYDWIALALVSLASMYTYYGLAWLFPILELDLVHRTWKKRSQERVIGYLVAHLTLVVGLALLYFFLLSIHIQRFTTNKDLLPRFITPGLRVIIKTLDTELLNGFVRFFSIPYSSIGAQLVVKVFAAFIIIGIVFLIWQGNWAKKRIVIYMLGTVAAMYVANGLGLYPFGGRYALAALPFVFMALAAVIEMFWQWNPISGLIAASMIVGTFVAFWPNPQIVSNPWLALPREELRPVVAYVNEQAEAGDFIYVYYGANPAYRVYQSEETYPTVFGPWFRAWPTSEKVADIMQSVNGSRRFWLVMSHINMNEYDELIGGLVDESSSYQAVDEFVKENAAAVLFQPTE